MTSNAESTEVEPEEFIGSATLTSPRVPLKGPDRRHERQRSGGRDGSSSRGYSPRMKDGRNRSPRGPREGCDLLVLVPAWNEAALLPAALSALARASAPFRSVRLVIVAGGGDGTRACAEDLTRTLDGIETTVIAQSPSGKMEAYRQALASIEAADAPRWLLLLDADTELEEGALVAATAFLERRKDLVGVGAYPRIDDDGIGAAHDRVLFGLAAHASTLSAVTGFAILLRGEEAWAHRADVFATQDDPLHIDYQICERLAARTGLHFAIAKEFRIRTARARGLAFVTHERRHHRAMFRRSPPLHWRRYVAGAALTTLLPGIVPAASATLLFPPALPLGALTVALGVRRLAKLRRTYRRATSVDPTLTSTPFAAYVRDEWFSSLAALLGAYDWARGRADPLQFRGPRPTDP